MKLHPAYSLGLRWLGGSQADGAPFIVGLYNQHLGCRASLAIHATPGQGTHIERPPAADADPRSRRRAGGMLRRPRTGLTLPPTRARTSALYKESARVRATRRPSPKWRLLLRRPRSHEAIAAAPVGHSLRAAVNKRLGPAADVAASL